MKLIRYTFNTRILIKTAIKYVRKKIENDLKLINSTTNRLIKTIRRDFLMKNSMLKISSIENHSVKVTIITMTLKIRQKSRFLKHLQAKKHFTN